MTTSIVAQACKRIDDNGIGPSLARINRGIEKESLRINQDGSLALTPHPSLLGSPLTHPYITTDYSEALLEFVTPVCTSVHDVLHFLHSIHQFVIQNLGEEHLWVTSMPCVLQGNDNIPIAQYGLSNIGRMKHIYRRGLAHRYGAAMQSISGIHFNFSLDDDFWTKWHRLNKLSISLVDFRSRCYFAIVRNFYRILWAVLYIYGSSPAVCKTFLEKQEHQLDYFGHGTFFLPYSTSLRMGHIGYQSGVQSTINIDLDGVNEYCDSLVQATNTPYAEYEKFDTESQGGYQQLNANLLQIENEYYAPVRPKRVARPGEKPTNALRERGVEYIEVRSIDLDPFSPVGIDETGIRFLELVLIGCLLTDSPPLDKLEMEQLSVTREQIVTKGRDPTTMIDAGHGKQTVADAGKDLVMQLKPIAELLDNSGETGYQSALAHQEEKFYTPGLTSSAQSLQVMRDQDISFFQFALERSVHYQQYFRTNTLSTEQNDQFAKQARDSIRSQKSLEYADKLSFSQFLNEYLEA